MSLIYRYYTFLHCIPETSIHLHFTMDSVLSGTWRTCFSPLCNHSIIKETRENVNHSGSFRLPILPLCYWSLRSRWHVSHYTNLWSWSVPPFQQLFQFFHALYFIHCCPKLCRMWIPCRIPRHMFSHLTHRGKLALILHLQTGMAPNHLLHFRKLRFLRYCAVFQIFCRLCKDPCLLYTSDAADD